MKKITLLVPLLFILLCPTNVKANFVPGVFNSWAQNTPYSTTNMPTGYKKYYVQTSNDAQFKLLMWNDNWTWGWGTNLGWNFNSWNIVWSVNWNTNIENSTISNFGTNQWMSIITSTSLSQATSKFGFLKTSAAPITIASVSGGTSNVNLNTSVDVTITLSGEKCEEEYILVRYTTDDWTTSGFVTATGSGTSYSASIPAQTSNKTVKWYAMTSTLNNPTTDTDYLTLSVLNNSGSNYTYYTGDSSSSDYFRSKQTGNWNTASNWESSANGITNWILSTLSPGSSASSITILNTHNITLDQNVTIPSLTINSGGTFTASDETPRTLTISSAGQLSNSGTFTHASGSVNFAGAGSVAGTVGFNNVNINGGVDFGSSSTINGYLNIKSGSYIQTNAPTYAISSVLKYNSGTIYGAFLEWADNVTSGKGVPYNVVIGDEVSGSGLTFGSITNYRHARGSITISDGASFSMSSNIGGDVKLAGNLTNNGTFTSNSRALFFDGTDLQTVSSTGIINIPYIFISNASEGVRFNSPVTAIDLTNNGKLTLATGVTVLSTGTISGSGSTHVEQSLSAGRQWWYLASPLSEATSNVIRPAASPHLIGDYTEATTSYSAAPFAAGSGTPLTVGKGYVVKFADTDARTITFTGGSLNTGTIPATVTRTGTDAPKRGFNLIGNPYPSYIDWDLVYADSEGMRNAIWFRTYSVSAVTLQNPSGMTFHTYSDGDGVPETTSPKIAPMQAFWVKVDADPVSPLTVSNGTLTFENTHREHLDTDPEVTYNPLKVKAADLRPRLRLVVSNGTASDETLIVGKSYASNLLDSYDIEKMSASSASIPEIYSLVQNQEMVINSMKELTEGNLVNLGFRPGQAGNFTFKVTQLENIDAKVVLVDNLSSTEMELTNGSEYSFTADASTTNNRFTVEFRTPGISTQVDALTADNMMVWADANNHISVQSGAIVNQDMIRVFTVAGQEVFAQAANGSTTLINHSFTPGVYLVNVKNVTRKVVVN